VGFATLAKLLTATLLRDSTRRAPRCLALWVTLGFGWGCTAPAFCLEFCTLFLNHDLFYGLKSGSNIQVDSRTVEWLRLYWFCHDIGTDNSTMAAESVSPKGIFLFFVVGTALELSFNEGGV
jgi:hypothetical protein